MSLFCLVHGSTENAAGWDLLVPELESQGQRAVRAELPTDDPQADAGRYADAILSAIPADAEDVLLVGHSGSGYLLPLVAAQRSVRRMVFLAAMLPEIPQFLIPSGLARIPAAMIEQPSISCSTTVLPKSRSGL